MVRLSQNYALDPRALSLLRIGIALVVIADLCIRCSDLTAHYTDEGLWPTRLVQSFGWKPGFWSLHALSGTYAWELALFIIHFIAAVSLLLGYRTTIATLVVWLLMISLHNRNAYVLQAGDDLLRLVLFWGLFLPWNACYSLDAKQQRHSVKQRPLANIGYLLLLASVYFFTAMLKSGNDWHGDSSAIYYALSLEQMRLPAGDWLYAYPGIMKSLTILVFYIELLIPILILLPSKKGTSRFIAFILILVLQAGIGLTLYVGLFFVISMVSALGLLPKDVMDRREKWLRLPPLKPRLRPLSTRFAAISNTLCLIVIILCLILNLSAFSWFSYELRSELAYSTNVLRLNQYWGMFSPNILKKDGWLVYHGADSSGQPWDLRSNSGMVDYNKPAHIVSLFKNARWRKLVENMQSNNGTFLRPLYCNYLLRQWNRQHPEKQLAVLNLEFMEKTNLAAYKSAPVIKLLYCVCNDH